MMEDPAILAALYPSPSGERVSYHNLGTAASRTADEGRLGNPYWGTGANAVDFDNTVSRYLVTILGRFTFRTRGTGIHEIGQAAGLSQKTAWQREAFGI